MEDWNRVPIGSVAEVFDGPHATPRTIDYGPIFLGIGALKNGRIDLGETRHVSLNDFAKWTRRVKPKPGDIVFSYETRLGEAAMIPEGLECCLGRRMGLVRPLDERLDSRFFLYYYLSPEFQDFIRSRTISGATVDRIALKEFPHFSIPLPDIGAQREISTLLGAIDDKIELNRRMNETLEASARALFRDWFVDFGPTRAKAEGRPAYLAPDLWSLFPDSFDGNDIPEGWQLGTLNNFTDIQNGYAFSSKDWTDGGVPVVKIGSIKPGLVDLHQVSFISKELAAERAAFRLVAGDMLVGLTGYVGETGFVPPTSSLPMLNQRVGRIRPIVDAAAYIFCALRDPAFKEFAVSKSHGSAQANVSTKSILQYPLPVPSDKIMKHFQNLTMPNFDQILLNHGESRTLAETRDTLLPKLMSGAIRVREAESAVAALC